MKILENFQIKLDDEEIVRLLRGGISHGKKAKAPSQKLLNDIKEMKDIAIELIQPRAIYDLFDSKTLYPRFLFKKAEKTFLSICTIGTDLEKKSSTFINSGELAKGVILDAIASHAAEETAAYANEVILTDITRNFKGKKYTSRFSPGYCQWDLQKGQELIFELLPVDSVGVSLSETKMMKPVKSVSFAVNVGTEIDEGLGERGCETCELINCSYRRLS